MNVFLEACGLHRMCASVSSLNLYGVQKLNNLVHATIGKRMHARIVQCSACSKLNVAEVEKLRSLNGRYLSSDIGFWHVLGDWLLVNALHLMLDMCFEAAKATLCADSSIPALKYVHCQNLHVYNTTTTSTTKYIFKCSVCGKMWYNS